MTRNDSAVTVRRAVERDIAAIADISAENCDNPWNAKQLKEELIFDFAYLFCAETDGVIAGFADMHILQDEARVNEVAVDFRFRRTGAGKRLIRECFETAKNRGCDEISLEVRVKNAVARSFYRALGFSDAGVRKDFYSDPSDDAVLMRKKLREEEICEDTGY